MGDKLIHFLEKAAIGQLPGHMVCYVVMLRMPGILQLVIPFAFYVAMLLSFGRLYSSQEMVILQSGGMSTRKAAFKLHPMRSWTTWARRCEDGTPGAAGAVAQVQSAHADP